MSSPLLEITSHIDGKNATVRIYPDRVEWERGKSMSKGKVALAAVTFGTSALATGLRTRKGAGVEMIPMRSITSVTQMRDSMLNDVVRIITAGNAIDLRCPRQDAEQLRRTILTQITRA